MKVIFVNETFLFPLVEEGITEILCLVFSDSIHNVFSVGTDLSSYNISTKDHILIILELLLIL